MVLRNLFSGQQWRNRHTEQTYGHGGRGGEGEMYGGIKWKLTLPHVKQTGNGTLMYDSGNSNGGSVSTYRGGMGGRFKREGHMYTYG